MAAVGFGVYKSAKFAKGVGSSFSGVGNKVKYIGKVDDLKGIPRNQTFLDDLPDIGSPRANWIQNSSIIRKARREGFEIRDASVARRNFDLDPTLLRPNRTVGQSFLGAERNLLNNLGGNFDVSRAMPRKLP